MTCCNIGRKGKMSGGGGGEEAGDFFLGGGGRRKVVDLSCPIIPDWLKTKHEKAAPGHHYYFAPLTQKKTLPLVMIWQLKTSCLLS